MPRTIASALLAAVLLLGTAGCGAKPESGSEPGASTSPPAGSTPAAMTLPADLDQGPRAGETPHDPARATEGERLFQLKGCTACHAFGKRVTGPDLAGVSKRRTHKWIEYQILHPDVMVKQDPTARELFAQYALQMPKQGLTTEEAHAVIEYLKSKDQ